ncbi:MAG: molecular chaperone TorD family protein [Sulfuricaulis sp.]|nr:molecular chaperone TorD family protein [Sulfuricaulis sp.]
MNLSASATNEKKMNQAGAGSNEGIHVLDRARVTVYQFLSLATLKPQPERSARLLDPGFQELAQAAVAAIQKDPRAFPDSLAPGEIALEALDLAPLISFLRQPKEDFREEFDRVFGLLVSRECPPYETEYCPQTFSVYRSQQLGDIAGYYRAFGLEPSHQSPERHDHIALELEFMAWLNTKTLYAWEQGDEDNASLCRDAQVSFFRDHLAWWTTAFALALRQKADGIRDERDLTSPPKSFQGAIGAFLAAFVPAERGVLGIAPPTTLTAVNVLASVEEGDAKGCETCALTTEPNFE